MTFLLLSIFSSTGIFILFKVLKKYNINTLQAIVVNYFTACTCGFLFYKEKVNVTDILNSSWFIGAVVLGFLFIAIFNIMALTAQRNGLSVASVASKMSVIIPVVFGIYVLKESIDGQKIIGICLALVAVYLTSVKKKDTVILTQSIYLPIILFFGSGIIDTSINYFAPDDKIELFSAIIFAIAASIGVSILIYKSTIHKHYFKLKSIPFGLALGLMNYGSIFYLLKALRMEDLESSTIFTINNVGIVTISTVVGLVLFKENMSTKNWLGIGIAITAIILVTLA